MAVSKPEDISITDGTLEKLEQSFQEAMKILGDQENLGRFRAEYEKLFRTLTKSHESEKRLVKRCQHLTQELMCNAAKMQAAIKLSQGDHSTIDALKKEIEKAWRTVDSAKEKDARARETIKKLKEEVASLQEIMDNGNALTSSQTATLEELKLERKRLQSEHDELVRQIDTYSREVNDIAAKTKEAELEMFNHQEEIRRLSDRERTVREEYEKDSKARGRADLQVRELMILMQQRSKELKAREQQQSRLEAAVNAIRAQLTEDQAKRQALAQKMETTERQLYHTQQALDDALDTTEALNERKREVRNDIDDLEKKFIDFRAEDVRLHRVRDTDFKELSRLIQQNEDMQQEQKNLRRQKANIQKRIDTVRREREDLNKACDLLIKEHHAIRRQAGAEREKMKLIEKVLANEVERQDEIESSVVREREVSLRLRQNLARLESEYEKYVNEVSQVTQQHTTAEEELKIATIICDETQKAIDESEEKLKKQQNVYEQVRAERNLYSKRLIESQDEVVELKQNFRMMDHQITQLKEEIATKEKKLKEETSLQKMAKERLTKVFKTVNDHTAAFDDSKHQCENVGQQIKQLVKVINQCDKDLSEQQQRFLAISSERDTLGTQLIRRNDELALLYEKVRIQQDTLVEGEVSYRARQEDMRLLGLKMNELQRQSMIAQKRAWDIEHLKEELRQLQYDLTVERGKVQALSEEAENPKNALRWQKSATGRDPTPAELDAKITQLQRRLITKSEKCVEKDIELQEKQRLVTELQNILARQPGPDVAHRLNAYQRELQHKNNVMKQKASEINMTTTHITELKYEAERLRRELHETKRKYYEMKMSNDELSKGPPHPVERVPQKL